jgi:putative glutamine amidotransferase
MSFLALLEHLEPQVTGRLRRMVGPDAAEDLRQELLLRAWRKAPRDLDEAGMRSWLHTVASNLAIDELRRRRHRDHEELCEDRVATVEDPDERIAAREALARVSADERAVLWLRFEAGMSHAEIGSLLGTTPEAARKRVSRARSQFVHRFREAPAKSAAPLILVIDGRDDTDAYLAWLRSVGARTKVLDRERPERDLATADGLLMTGSLDDVHPALYGEAPRSSNGIDLRLDLGDLRTLRAAVRQGVPVLGVCRGHQLLNIAMGGTLYQDVVGDGLTRTGHSGGGVHDVDTSAATTMRRWLGARPEVSSEHHQALRRLGRGLRVTSTSPDGVAESVELMGPSFAVGIQWHPEVPASGDAGMRVAEGFVETCRVPARAA